MMALKKYLVLLLALALLLSCSGALAATYTASELVSKTVVRTGQDQIFMVYDERLDFHVNGSSIGEQHYRGVYGEGPLLHDLDPRSTLWQFQGVSGTGTGYITYIFNSFQQRDESFTYRVEYLGDGRFQLNTKEPPLYIEMDGKAVEFTFENGVITVLDMPAGATSMTLKWASSTVGIGFTKALY